MAKNGTVAYITEPKICDICKLMPTNVHSIKPPRDAEYDFRTSDGRWANGCGPHYLAFRMYDTLGIGKGQKLEVKSA